MRNFALLNRNKKSDLPDRFFILNYFFAGGGGGVFGL